MQSYQYETGGIGVKSFDRLPAAFQCDAVRPYYDKLCKKTASLVVKRIFDIVAALVMLAFLILPILVIAVLVKATSPGHVFFRQERTDGDSRVTKIGRVLRKYRLDELPQIFNVLGGSMSFVGTRPEVPRYVEQYQPEYYATLLLPAGITSLASIMYKDEEKLLSSAEDADRVYIETVLPEKMKYNLQYVKSFGFFSDIKLMFKTVIEVVS